MKITFIFKNLPGQKVRTIFKITEYLLLFNNLYNLVFS